MLVRTIAETLSKNLVFRRTFSGRFRRTRIYVSPEGGLRYWRLNVEKADPILLAAAEHLVKPGAVVWDIGANVGLFSMAAAALAGPEGTVVSVDADEWLTALVSRSIEMNGARIAPVRQLTAAISNSEGVAEFCIARRARSSSYLQGFGTSQTGGSREVRSVPTRTLDSLAQSFPAPQVLKIDVEGAEELVLRGGAGVIATARPAIFCEVGSENIKAVTRLLTAQGYRLFDASAGFANPKPVRQAVWNTLALPN